MIHQRANAVSVSRSTSGQKSFARNAPHRSHHSVRQRLFRRDQPRHVVQADLTAGFLEAVAAAALQSRLRQHSLVRASIDCDGFTLLQGRVRSVAIAGRDWISPLGLSAVILEVSLGRAELDVGAILQQQRILLRGVPVGSGRIVFTAPQFGAFLRHPLMIEAAATAVQGHSFDFDSEAVYDGESGAVLMSGLWRGDDQHYRLRMVPSGSAAIVQAAPQDASAVGTAAAAGATAAVRSLLSDSAESPGASEATAVATRPTLQASGASVVATELTAFFSGLTLDLQGPELRYAGMQVVPFQQLGGRMGVLPPAFHNSLPPLPPGAGGAAGRDVVLDLRLTCRVLGFPPANPQF
eukprot:CAMPEP_0206147730 /NCGR_PEP_ID=MMETSP1473-20131121/34366_1 /ASSEMBLY_ACC=CAM_ASM_001109 /TAXON_ID=1461547 /ORGANISM="Stichococcus sp, Strain RCC1054" /LENGTH=351 /DNA_ID=CAMNT_0053544799 /DNA_START=285 /DNA_END=1340 /DNA_ORIENTATION=-